MKEKMKKWINNEMKNDKSMSNQQINKLEMDN